jgi:hypothetical protein
MILGLELLNEIEDRLGYRQTDTLDDPEPRPQTRKLVRLLNRVLRSMQRIERWPLLRRDASLVTVASLVGEDYFTVTPGSLTLEQGASATGDLVFDESMVTRAVKLGSDSTVYRIVSVESPTSLTLSKPWVGEELDDDETAYFIGQDQYALPADFDQPAGPWDSFLAPYKIDPVPPEDFKARRSNRGNNPMVESPDVFTVYGLTPGGNQQVLHLDPFPKDVQVLNYAYQIDHPKIATDADRVLIPTAKQDAVIEGVLYLATRDYTDDTKMEMVLRDFMNAISRTGSRTEAEKRAGLSPSGSHRLRSRGQWGGNVRINWGSLFERSDRVGFD